MINIGHDQEGNAITIDAARLIGTRMLVQANSGGGKSWMLRVLCERLGRSTPLIVLDWEGEFASLREKLDVLLVGRDGEIPTAVATAGALATQTLEIGVSVIVDLYDLNPNEKREYVRRFIDSLMAAPKRLWSPRIVVVDEAHNLCPESGDAVSAGSVIDLATAGRKRQFCAVLATQRLSKLAKDAAAELNNNLIGRCALDVDQKRAADILGMSKADWPTLRDLDAGEFFAFGPAFNFKGVRKFRSADVETTHGFKAGASAKPPEPSARMARVVDQLKDLAERAKTEVLDLDSARATIRDLRKQLATKDKAAPVANEKAVERAVSEARQSLVKSLVPLLRTMRDASAAASKRVREANADAETLERMVGSFVALMEAEPAPAAPSPRLNGHATRAPAPKREPMPVPEGLTPRHAEVLSAIHLCHAMGYDTPTREQVSFWSGKRGGNFNNLLGALRSAGAIEYPNGGTVRALAAPENVPDQAEAYERAMRSISPRLLQVLEAVIAAGGPATRESISEVTGKSGGNFNNLLGALRTAGLIVYPSSGMVDAAEWLRDAAGASA